MNESMTNLLEKIGYFLLRHHGKEKLPIKESYLADVLFLFASTILTFFLSILVSVTTTFLLGGSIEKFHILFSFVILLPFIFFSVTKIFHNRRFLNGLLVILLFIDVLGLCIFVSGKFYDLSYDGQAYHQETIIYLKEKWNPFYTTLSQEDTRFARFLNHYPKGSEILDASLFSISNKIEYSKSFNFLFVIMAFSFVLSLLLRLNNLSLYTAVVVSLLLIFNPINIYQSLSFYIDARIYNLILSFLALIGTLYLVHRNYFLLPFIFILPILLSFKVTLFIYTLIFLFFFILYMFYTERISLLFKVIALTLPTLLFSFVVINFNPYLTNHIHKGHPFYPAMGNNATDYSEVNSPNNIKSQNSLNKLIISIFSRTNNAKADRLAELKRPFTFDKEEMSKLVNTGNNIGGFGVLFSGIFILTLLSFLGLLIYRSYLGINNSIFYIIFVIFLTVVVNPAAFYSRFVPQLWIVPTLITSYLLINRFVILKITSLALILLIIFNNLIIIREYFSYQYIKSTQLKNELTNLSDNAYGKTLIVNFDMFNSVRLKLDEYDIKYEEDKTLECTKKLRLFKGIIDDSKIEVCDYRQNS